MNRLAVRNSFKKDLKRTTKRGHDRALLEAVVDQLRQGRELPQARRDHSLKGEWKHWRECHIAPNWLLIYRVTEDEVLLARTGTHADLFGM